MAYLALTKSKHLQPFVEVLCAHGMPIKRLLSKANLPVSCLDDPDTFIPAACVGPFRELAAEKLGYPNISLETIPYIQIEVMGGFGQASKRESTLLVALDKFRQFVISETSNVVIELRPQSNGYLWFGQRILTDIESGAWHSKLYVIIWMLKIVQLADPAWSPTEISIGLNASRERFAAIEILGSTARFQQADTGFLIPASMLTLPIARNRTLGAISSTNSGSTAPAETYAESIRQVVRSYATGSWLSIDQLSEVAGTSVRTLQRRLGVEQQTYSSLVQQCRAEMAGDLLENTDVAIADIANRLGYGSQGNFTRAFYGWAKVSPSEFRKQRSYTR